MTETRRELTLLCRIEMDEAAMSAWTSSPIDPARAEGISGAEWTGYISRAFADGELQEDLPDTIEGCLAYLNQSERGFAVTRHEDHIEIAFDRDGPAEHDMVFVRGALAAIVFEHAVAQGASAYLWLAGTGSVMGDEFFHSHSIGQGGDLVVEEDEESTEYGSLSERFSDLLWQHNDGWSVGHDLAETPDGDD